MFWSRLKSYRKPVELLDVKCGHELEAVTQVQRVETCVNLCSQVIRLLFFLLHTSTWIEIKRKKEGWYNSTCCFLLAAVYADMLTAGGLVIDSIISVDCVLSEASIISAKHITLSISQLSCFLKNICSLCFNTLFRPNYVSSKALGERFRGEGREFWQKHRPCVCVASASTCSR